MKEIMQTIRETGIIPVIRLEETEKAEALAKALKSGGIEVAEVTFRAAGAEIVIDKMRTAFPNMAVGAGTVLTVEQAKAAKAAGAGYIVAPGYNPKVVDWCQSENIPVVPGCVTPSEIETALEAGLKVVKFFPAEQSGGLNAIKALCGPYSGIDFIPTGGITLDNLEEYIRFPRIAACGGSFMVSSSDISQNRWDVVSDLCRKAVKKVLGFRVQGIALPEGRQAELMSALLCCEQKGHNGITAGSVAVTANSVSRAAAYFARMGFEGSSPEKDIWTLNDTMAGIQIRIVKA